MRSQAQLSSGSIHPMQSRGSKDLGGVGSETAGIFGETGFLDSSQGRNKRVEWTWEPDTGQENKGVRGAGEDA